MGKKTSEIIQKAVHERRKSLSEHESKLILKAYDIPVTREIVVCDEKQYAQALDEIGYPLVIKVNSPNHDPQNRGRADPAGCSQS